MLQNQYRMHPRILKVPNYLFYGDDINNMYKLDKNFKYLNYKYPILFINHEVDEKFANTTFYNDRETDIIVKLSLFLTREFGYSTDQLGFISPYVA